MNAIFSLRGVASPLLATWLCGCAGTATDRDVNTVNQTVQQTSPQNTVRLRQEPDTDHVEQRVSDLLRQPLSVNDAVQIALMQHRQQQASTDVPTMREAWSRTAEQTRKSYYQSIAATQSVRYLEQAKQAAEAVRELTARMATHGNVSQLDAMREHVFYLETSARLLRAQTQAIQERENLIRLLGLRASDGELRLPQRLPDLPKQGLTLAHPADMPPEIRAAYAAYQHTFALAQQYQNEVIPLRKRISDEYLLRYNGMLVSVFELLADAREQADAVNTATKAALEFWIADGHLQVAIGGPAIVTQYTTEGKIDD